MSTLYMMATPIGNLGDMTFRALDVLKSVGVVAVEDPHHALPLLTHFGLRKRLISCKSQNEEKAAAKVVEALDAGDDVAYISDAGTPVVSDPGAVLVDFVRKTRHSVSPIPGASAFTSIWSVAGSCGKSVLFDGFLSPSPGKRRKRLSELLAMGVAFVLYESPFRVVKLLDDIASLDDGRKIVVGREMTKLHEEFLTGSASELRDELSSRERILGEFALLVAGVKKTKTGGKDS